MNEKINHSIGCAVKECTYHDKTEDYCTLQQIHVGKCSMTSESADCTECSSYQQRKDMNCR